MNLTARVPKERAGTVTCIHWHCARHVCYGHRLDHSSATDIHTQGTSLLQDASKRVSAPDSNQGGLSPVSVNNNVARMEWSLSLSRRHVVHEMCVDINREVRCLTV